MTVVIVDPTYSDLHKDVYGFRPNYKLEFKTQKEADEAFARLVKELAVVQEQEYQFKLRNQKELKQEIRDLMAVYNIDAVTALGWKYDSMDREFWDWEDFCYTLGIGFKLASFLYRHGVKHPRSKAR